jgi:hypothetical protein
VSVTRTRGRRCPDWLDENPGWSGRRRVTSPSGTVTENNYRGQYGYTGSLQPRGREFITDENLSQHFGVLLDPETVAGDVGCEMSLTRSGVLCDNREQHLWAKSSFAGTKTETDYFGPVYATDPHAVTLPSIPNQPDLDVLGTTAINRVKPTNRVVSLAVDLAEMRSEGLPSLYGVPFWKEKTNLAKAAGSEYLNSEFGWKPLVGDIRSACYAAANAHKILSSYERNSHGTVRRRYEFPVVRTENWTFIGSSTLGYFEAGPMNVAALLQSSWSPRGQVFLCERFYKRTWFSGAFTYHLPIGFKNRNKLISAAAKAGPLVGIELTPEVVWNATPWTWALDWVSNIGDLVGNYSDMAVDGLVIKYGYMMEHIVSSKTYYYYLSDGFLPASLGRPSSVTAYVETKRRKRATPFGFGVDFDSFTPRQLAITAALGLTRWF